jgi:hypothetical protein
MTTKVFDVDAVLQGFAERTKDHESRKANAKQVSAEATALRKQLQAWQAAAESFIVA